MELISAIQNAVCEAFELLFNVSIPDHIVKVEETTEEYEGDLTVLIFPLARFSKKAPAETAAMTGEFLKNKLFFVENYITIKGFLNLVIKTEYWVDFLNDIIKTGKYIPKKAGSSKKILIEFSSPNTNKPLHLGHVRNCLIGNSISEILKIRGHRVTKISLLNDRGIHICKSMLAWQKFGNSKTPESAGLKSDHLVGEFYVLFDKKLKEELASLIQKGMSEDEAMLNSSLMAEIRQMLINWEKGDSETRALWQKMNSWVYNGFEETYGKMGIKFDKLFYESDIYLFGKSMVIEGLKRNIFFEKADGSVWADLSDYKLDEKLLLRADGTSVYITQDIGSAQLRYDEYHPDLSVYVVGNEQDYHFQVMKSILTKLGKPYADNIFHLSYGMVDLPAGRMKTREGTVVDADELMDEMIATAREYIESSGKISDIDANDIARLNETIGLAALKFFILKTDAKKRILFNPEESIDFQGHTGPFIQYTYARIQSILRKLDQKGFTDDIVSPGMQINQYEKELLKKIYQFDNVLQKAENELDPSLVANYVYSLAKIYNKFYHEYQVMKETDTGIRNFRINLSVLVATVVKLSMNLLGIEVPEKM